MGKFSELNLSWRLEDNLNDLEEEFHITKKSTKELNDLIKKLNGEAYALNDTAATLENKAIILEKYLDIIER